VSAHTDCLVINC